MIKKLFSTILIVLLHLSNALFAQDGKRLDDAITVNLPFDVQNISTCGAGNDYSDYGGEQAYGGGEDLVYSFIATETGKTILKLTGGNYTGLYITKGDPSLKANILISNLNDDGTDNSVLADVVAGERYYIIIDNWPSPDCNSNMKLTGTLPSPNAVPNTQDCLGAIPVCTYVYSNPTSYSGTGNITGEINAGVSCLHSGEKNDVWYQFTVQTSGSLCFCIDPVTNTNDYDWAVYNLTNANCSDISSNAALEVACNYSGSTSWAGGAPPAWVTSASTTGNTGLFPSGSGFESYSQNRTCITVSAGESYVMNVSNYSSSANGYTLYFPPPGTAGMASIYDNVPPVFQTITTAPACGATSIDFNFSENILCSTISAADFTVTGPGGTYTVTAVSGAGCTAGVSGENTYTATISPAISTAGSFQFCLVTTAGSVTDLCGNVAAAGCINFTISGPTVTTSVVNVACNGGNSGSVTAVGAGGSGAPYTYSIDGTTFQASGIFAGLTAGTYTLTAKDAGGCMGQTTVTVTEPLVLAVTATPTNASCAGNNGSIATVVSGGTVAYAYSWAPSGAGSGPANLSTGTYTVTVTDSKGCTATGTATIGITGSVTSSFTAVSNQCLTGNSYTFTNTGTTGAGNTFAWSFNPSAGAPASSALENYGPVSFTAAGSYTVSFVITQGACTSTSTQNITIYADPAAPTITTANSTCGNANGSLTVTAPTGAAYQYSLNGGAYQAAVSFNNYAAATYTITVQNSNACTSTGTATISNTGSPTAVVLTAGNSTCGNSNGTVTIGAVTGGTAAYTYSFDASAFTATTSYTGLTATTHTVIVKDANGCQYTQNVTVSNTPGPTALAVTSTNSTCGNSNGTVTIGAVTGGTAAYTYSFNGGAYAATTAYSNLAAATYNVIVKDANNCLYTTTITVTNTPGPTAVALTGTNTTCGNSNGTVTIGAVTGGTAAYTYSFNASAYTATTVYNGLAAGTHTVIVKDANGCLLTQTNTITNVAGPTAIATSTTNSVCGGSNGTATLGAVTGGTAAFTYSFNGSAFSATTNYAGLAAGTYAVIVQDANSCQYSTTLAVSNSGGPTALVVSSTNTNCVGNTGTVTIGAVTAGTAPYTYSFDGSAFSATTNYTSVAQGTFNVIVKDVNGCQYATTVTVGVVAGPTAVVLTPGNSTCGNNNGTLTIGAVTGGTSAYTYSFDGSAFTATTAYAFLTASTHTVIVKDANGCEYTTTSTIANTAGPTAVVVTSVNSTCGNANGTLTIGAVTGGTSAYTYSVNGGVLSATTTYTLTAANHTVLVNDANGCQYSTTATIADTPGPTNFTTTTTQTACAPSSGTITVSAVVGGTANYTYSFNNGSTYGASASGTGLAAGTYTVFVKDANNCTYSKTASITTVSSPTDLTFANIDATCGLSNGTINATGAGGTAPYQYALNAGANQASGTFNNVSGTTYTITVTDNNGCTYSETTTLINTGLGVPSIAFQADVKCFGGNDGNFTIAMTGGTSPYTFSMNPGGVLNGTGVFSGLSIGTYSVTILDALNCQSTINVSIGQPPILSSSISSQTNVACFGGSTGAVTVAAAGGSPAYDYSINGSAAQASGTFSGLTAVSYTVSIRDNGGCTVDQPVTITQATAISLTVNPIVNANCTASNGTATVSASGGTPGYTYSWSGGGGTAAITTGLPSGTYTVTVTDNNSCTQTATAAIGIISGGVATMSNVTNITCNGLTNGSLTVSMGGNANAPFTYAWTPNAGNTATVSNLSTGTYNVTVTDVYGCVSTTNATIAEPLALAVNLTSNNVSCNGGSDGSITANASGGTGALTYIWNPGAFTTSTINSLPIGSYTVTVSDANGCNTTANRTLVAPPVLTITSTVSEPNCGQADGSISVVGGGGAGAGYLFSINGAAFQASGSYTGLTAGTYTITIKDANQCTKSYPVQLVDQTGPAVALVSKSDVKCNGGNDGTITVTASGGAPPYTYLWNTVPNQTTPSATNLSQGIYSINVTDIHGCIASLGVTINQPAPMFVNTTFSDPVCYGQSTGTASVSAFGGTPGYTYSWSTLPAQTTATISGLNAGPYNVLVTDGNGCTQIVGLTLTNPPVITATIAKTDLNCYNVCNGTAVVSVNNGTTPYHYVWTDPNHQTSQGATGLCAGSYTVAITDYKGCTASASTTLTQPTLLTSSISNQVNIDCSGNCNGSAQVSAGGGTPPYTYGWSSGTSTTAIQSNLCAANYTVTVTDAKGCTSLVPINITEPTALALTASSTDASCYNVCDGTATANFSGGTQPYSFLWQSSLSTVFNPTGLCAGTHSVTLTDSKGCVRTASVVINQPNVLQASTTVTASNCLQSNGSACVQVSGGTSPFTYLWSNGATNACNNNINGNIYTVDVTDAKGCTIQAAANVNDISAPTVTITASTNITCYGLNNGTATATVAGGITPYSSTTWLLPNLNANPVQNGTGLRPGNNTIKVVDGAGCVSSATVNITEPPQLVSAINNIHNVTCNPANGSSCNGNATMLVGGGTSPYTYIWAGAGNQTTATAVSLCAGTYTCTVTDSKGCTTSKPATITQPLPLVIVTNSVSNVACYGYQNGQINTSPTGGTPPYTFSWSPNAGTGPVVTNLYPQLYNLLVTDNNGCVAASAYNIQQPDSMKVTPNTTPSTCSNANGSITLAVTGGTPSYTYHWNDPNAQTAPIASNLSAPAPYSCVITDAHGCSKSVTVNLLDLPGPTIDSTIAINVSCHGFNNGSATVYPKSGTGPYTYTWTNGGGTSIGSAINISGLVAGTYNIVVKDANNCIIASSVNVIEPQILSVITSQNMTACNGQILGVYAAAGGGTPPYTYTWSGAGTGLTGGGNHNLTFTNPLPTVATLSYTASVTDAHNCPAMSGQFNVTVLPKIFPVVTNPTFGCDAQDITLTAAAVGGDGAPYQFFWSNGHTGSGIQDTIHVFVQAGITVSYSVTVSDGCSTSEDTSINISIYPKPVASMLALDTKGCSSLAVTFAGSEGGSAFNGSSFAWTFGDGDTSSLKNPSHIYVNNSLAIDTFDVQLIVTSPNGCTDTATNIDYVVVYPLPQASFTTDPASTTILYPEVTMTNTSLGAIAYSWDFGDPNSPANASLQDTAMHAYEIEGTYTVTLTAVSSQACIDTATQIIHVGTEYSMYIPNAFTPNGDGKNEVFMPVSVGVDINSFHMFIYDRWGELLFETDKIDNGWDGKVKGKSDAQQQSYIYKIIALDKNGNKYNLTGHVTVMR